MPDSVGITVPQGAQLQLNNVAAVMVTADGRPSLAEGRPWTSPFLPSPMRKVFAGYAGHDALKGAGDGKVTPLPKGILW